MIPRIIKEAIGKKDSMSGKAPNLDKFGNGSYINLIPSNTTGACTEDLLVLCFDGDKLSSRLTEMIFHAGIYCLGKNKNVFFATSQWGDKLIRPYKRAIEILRDKGVSFTFVLISRNGVSEIHE